MSQPLQNLSGSMSVATRSIWTCSHDGHSYERVSKPFPSGSIRASIMRAPQRVQIVLWMAVLKLNVHCYAPVGACGSTADQNALEAKLSGVSHAGCLLSYTGQNYLVGGSTS